MNILRQSTPFCVVSAIVLAVLAVVRGFVAPIASDAVGLSSMPLAEWLESSREVGMGLYVSLVLLTIALCMVNVLSASLYNVDAGGRSSLPLPTWTMLGCCAVFPRQALTSYVAAWVMTVALKNVAKAYRRSYSFGSVFVASFSVGVLTLLYAPFAVLWILLPLVWMFTKRTGRELMVGMVGAFLPILTAGYVDWVRGGEFVEVFRQLASDMFAGRGYLLTAHFGGFQLVIMSLWLTMAVVFAIAMLGASSQFRSKARTTGYVHIVTLAFLAGSLLLGGSGPIVIPVAAVVVAQLSPKSFARGFARWSSIAYLVFVVAAVCYNIYLFLPH